MQRRLLPVILTLVLLIAGQIIAFVTLAALMNQQENQRRVSEKIFIQRTAVAAYVRHTQIALFALATSDWELLIRERRGADEVAETYEQTARALLAGAHAHPGQFALKTPQVRDPELRLVLDEAARRWAYLKITALAVLRADRFELKENERIAEFVQAIEASTSILDSAFEHSQEQTAKGSLVLARAQFAVPAGSLLLVLILALFVYRRSILPLDQSVRELERSETEVLMARDRLEERVRERTAELERATRAVRESEVRLQSILDNTTAVIYLKDLDGRYLLINREYERLFHVTGEQMRNKTDFDLFPRAVAELLRENDAKALRSGSAIQLEEIVPQDDGLHTYVSVKFPLFDTAGHPYGVCGISTDLTEFKRAEELLLAAERTARSAAEASEHRAALLSEASACLSESLEYSAQLIWLSRFCVRELADWCIIDIIEEKGVVRAAGAHRDPDKEPVLRDLQQKYPPSLNAPHPSAAVLRSGEPLLLDSISDADMRRSAVDDEHARLIAALGTRSAVAVPLTARGQVIGVLTLAAATAGRFGHADLELARELAQRAAVAIDNARLYRASQEAVRLREEFIMVASHELRTPLTSLNLTLATLKKMLSPPSTPPTTVASIELGVRSGARLEKLVADLLDATRLERGVEALTRSFVDLGVLVDEVLLRLRPELKRAHCETVVRARAQVLGFWDRSLLDQLISKLASNAAKFGAGQPIEIDISEQGGMARLVVRDHGIGIDHEQQAHIFDRFGRGVPATHYGGLGLGLYISRKIVEQHGGSIEVSSELGAGAAFVVMLPTALDLALDAHGPRASTQSA